MIRQELSGVVNIRNIRCRGEIYEVVMGGGRTWRDPIKGHGKSRSYEYLLMGSRGFDEKSKIVDTGENNQF
jgi:hypothetical protein